MKKPAAETQQEKIEIEQLSQAEPVELVRGLKKIIEELQEKLAIANGKGRTNSKTSSQSPSLDLIQKSEKGKDQTEVSGSFAAAFQEGGLPGKNNNNAAIAKNYPGKIVVLSSCGLSCKCSLYLRRSINFFEFMGYVVSFKSGVSCPFD